jgi:hypothetical protein
MNDLENDKDIDMPFLMGDVSAIVKEIKPAGEIVREMIQQAVAVVKQNNSYLVGSGPGSKL